MPPSASRWTKPEGYTGARSFAWQQLQCRLTEAAFPISVRAPSPEALLREMRSYGLK